VISLINPTSAQDLGTSTNLRLLDMPELWIVVLVLVPLGALAAWGSYARESLPGTVRLVLSGLRLAAFSVLALILFRPVFVERSEEVRPAEVLVLLDDSASMRRQDAYQGDAASAKLLERHAQGPLRDEQRLHLARRAVENELVPLLEKGQYEVRRMRFAEDATPFATDSSLSARGRGTHIGDAIRRGLKTTRGRHVTALVVVTDGRSNGGTAPLDAARAAAAEGIAIHTVVVGDTRPERNLLVELAGVPSAVLEGDEIAISVRVAGRGTNGAGSTQVQLEELDSEGQPARLLAEENAAADESGERVNFIAPPESLVAGVRVRRFRITVAPLRDETLLDDNSVEFSVRIMPEKIRVLYIDGYPRWEYRFLKELLKRSDQNISAQIYLLSATPDFPQEHSSGLESLSRVPSGRKELLDNYDVIILGDINPAAISPDPKRCEEFAESLVDFVRSGGGVLFQAGEYENPRSLRDTELEQLLPVVLDSSSGLPYRGDTSREFRPTLEDPATPHSVVRLHADNEVNRVLWEEPGGLRGHFWYSAVNRAKPGSGVLLRHPTEAGPFGRHPLLVVGYYPAGRSLFMALDSTWMWRYRFGDRYHGRFWRNAIRWLALGRLKGGDRRFSLDSLRESYSLDETITLEARVLDEDYSPSDQPSWDVRLVAPDGKVRELTLQRVSGQDGRYRTTFEVGQPGVFSAAIEVEGQRLASTDIDVRLPSRENSNPAPDPELLAAVARVAGGRSVDLAHLGELAAAFPGGEERHEPISSRLQDAWDNWYSLALVLALLSCEWILRKRFELV
jgi:hypothetical protein